MKTNAPPLIQGIIMSLEPIYLPLYKYSKNVLNNRESTVDNDNDEL